MRYLTPPERVGEARRREAVDKVTAMQFDRHGHRIWRDARALLESGHARYGVGETAVPYGTCTEITVAQIARAAGVDRTFIYRHRDLLTQLHALEATPPATSGQAGPAVTRASLQADLLAAGERAIRLHSRVRQLEQRLSEALGEQAWHESGLGVHADTAALSQTITHLEQQAIDLRLQLEERDQDLAAARATNRELMAQLNTPARPR